VVARRARESGRSRGQTARACATREEAAQHWLKVAGLHGLWPADSPAIDAGLIDTEDGWRTALHPQTFGVGAPDMPGLLAASRAEIVLAAGEKDPMCPAEVAVQPEV
jgi:hypothetical protein